MLLERIQLKRDGTIGKYTKDRRRCEQCQNVFDIQTKTFQKRTHLLDYCKRCYQLVVCTQPEYRAKMSAILLKRNITDPTWKQRLSESHKRNGVNLGEKNGMKQPEARAKVSKTRSEKFATDSEFKEMVAECTRQAWADGKYEGVNVGRCKWHDFIKKDGTIVRCQGTWELVYAKYLDANDIQFTSHNAMNVKYVDENGVQRTYLPDFYLTETNEYIDVKSDYTTSLQPMKIDQVRASNPNMKLRVVGKNELVELGILNKGGLPII